MSIDLNTPEFKTLEFVIFSIEAIASRLHVDAADVYKALAEKSHVLQDYLVPSYDVLHTQSKDYLVEDLLDALSEKGINL